MVMNTQHREIAALLRAVEQAMLDLELWSEQAPTAAALASQQPFCIDTLNFPQWLQFVFLPRLHGLIENGAELPVNCQVAPMAEMYFREPIVGRNHAELIRRLAEVDASLSQPR